MGDTAIEWALGVAKICYAINAGEPRSAKMRNELLEYSVDVLKNNYDSKLEFREFKNLVFEEIKRLQIDDKNFWKKSRLFSMQNKDLMPWNKPVEDFFKEI